MSNDRSLHLWISKRIIKIKNCQLPVSSPLGSGWGEVKMPNATYIALIPLLPLAGFLMLGLFGRKYFKNTSGIIGTALLLVSTVLAIYVAYDFFSNEYVGFYPRLVVFKYTWLQFSEGVSIDMGIMIDPISVMMLVVVTFISLMVHIYSLAYMKGDERFPVLSCGPS